MTRRSPEFKVRRAYAKQKINVVAFDSLQVCKFEDTTIRKHEDTGKNKRSQVIMASISKTSLPMPRNLAEPGPPKPIEPRRLKLFRASNHHTEVSRSRRLSLRIIGSSVTLEISNPTSWDRTRLLPTKRTRYYHR